MGHDHVERSRDWFRQAERDLQHARTSTAHAEYEWACFACQQAAEKALKALYQAFAGEGWGHSISVLLEGIDSRVPISEELRGSGRQLDRMYMPTRSALGFEHGIPGDYFALEDARTAIEDAHAVMEFARPHIP